MLLHFMGLALVVVSAGSSSLVAQAAPQQLVSGALGARLDSICRRFEQYGFSGAIAVADSGRDVLLRAYGWSDIERGRRTLPSTLYNVASVDKSFIAALILALSERRVVQLTDTLGRFFPSLRAPHSGISLRHLLIHRSGLARDHEVRQDGLLDTRAAVLRVMASIQLSSAPGERFAYSNLGYNVLKAVAEVAAGASYQTLVSRYVSEPAGMQLRFDTTVVSGQAAVGYRGPSGAPLRVDPDGDRGETYAGGVPFATVPDLYRWLVALRAGRVIADSSLAGALDPALGDYGFGWFIYPNRLAVTGGDTEGFQTTILFGRSSGFMLVAATNMRSDDRRGWWRGAITKATQLILRGRTYAPPPPPVTTPLEPFAGTYRFASGATLTATPTAQGGVLIVPRGQDALDALAYPNGDPPPGLDRANEAANRVIEALLNDDTVTVVSHLREDVRDIGVARLTGIWRQASTRVGGARRHQLLGSIATTGQAWQTYVELAGPSGADTLRLLWAPEGLGLQGWGLGGGDPVALRFLPISGGTLAAYLPSDDITIRIEAAQGERGEIDALRTPSGRVAARVR